MTNPSCSRRAARHASGFEDLVHMPGANGAVAGKARWPHPAGDSSEARTLTRSQRAPVRLVLGHAVLAEEQIEPAIPHAPASPVLHALSSFAMYAPGSIAWSSIWMARRLTAADARAFACSAYAASAAAAHAAPSLSAHRDSQSVVHGVVAAGGAVWHAAAKTKQPAHAGSVEGYSGFLRGRPRFRGASPPPKSSSSANRSSTRSSTDV
jgi:GH24 family phage-related lysozyme (muramidase)